MNPTGTRHYRAWIIPEAVLLVFLIGYVDYLAGYEVSLFPLYSIPILLVMWLKGDREAAYIAALSTVTWWCSDTASGHRYSHEWFQVWHAAIRFMLFYLVIVAGSAFRQQRDANRARIELLERSQKLEKEIINISEREQQRLGRDLHDGLGQYLVAIGMAADSLKDDLEKESLRGAREVGRIADLLHQAVIRTRELARGLSPVDRHEGGLEAALEELATSATQLSGISCSFISDGPASGQDPVRSLHLFRIAQEAVNNAIKHARPKLIVIALEAGEDHLALRVSDDGQGLKEPNDAGGGMGFNIMRYRARMIGGNLEISPNFPTGVVVSCSMSGETGDPQDP